VPKYRLLSGVEANCWLRLGSANGRNLNLDRLISVNCPFPHPNAIILRKKPYPILKNATLRRSK